MNARELAIIQINAAQAALHAARALLESEAPTDPAAAAGICTHPPKIRQDRSTMGNEAWTCTGCGFSYDQSQTEGATR